MKVKGFEPYFAEGCDTLILGSFPSVKSRATDFYYGHPQNRFWRTLAEYHSAPLPTDNAAKKAFVAAHGIRRIFTVGKRAHDILCAAYPELTDIVCLLPSTSPANPRFDKEKWFDALRNFRRDELSYK